MENTNATAFLNAKRKESMKAKTWSWLSMFIYGILGLYVAAMAWEAVRGFARFMQMRALLSGAFENDTISLTNTVRLVDIVSCILLVLAWLCVVLWMQHRLEKSFATKGAFLPLLCRFCGAFAVILAVALVSGLIFGGQVLATWMYIQIIVAAVVGVGLWLVPRFVKR